MRRSILSTLIFFMLSLSLISVASAEIIFSQTESVYNLNDELSLQVMVKPVDAVSGFLELNLNCEDTPKNFYKEYVSLEANDEKQVVTSLPLDSQFVAKIGVCSIEAVLNSLVIRSKSFEVSDDIDVSFTANKVEVEPGDYVTISGSAVKKNGDKVDGFVDVYIVNSDLNITSTVKNGNFSMELKMPENMRAGSYSFKCFVYEKINSGIINNGEAETVIKMLSVPHKIEVAVSSTEADPGENITFKPVVYDQANEEINDGEIIAKIKDSNGRIVGERVINPGEEDSVFIKQNDIPGNWEISFSAFGLSAAKNFEVKRLERAEFVLENNTLIVRNTGNVVYTKSINVKIGDKTEVVDTNGIAVDGVKKFKLYAPDGTYNVQVTDGNNEASSGDVMLTGSAIRVKDAAINLSFGRYLLIWGFMFAILAFFIYNTAGKVWLKKKTYDVNESSAEKKEVIISSEPKQESIKKLSEFVSPGLANPDYAEHTIALHGEKQLSCLLTLNVKNPEKMEAFKEILGKIKEKITEKKGSIYQSNNFLFGIFSPMTTKTFKNELQVIKLASEINDMLKSYNQKFKERMEFGLAVHTGDLILEKSDDKLKFTSSADNTLAFAKKLSEMAKNEFLISQSSYKNSGSEIKADKEEREKIWVYHLQRLSERNDNSKFIHDFLNRNREFFAKKD